MSYAAAVAPKALDDFRKLDVDAQEAVLDLLDGLAQSGSTLAAGGQFHDLWLVHTQRRRIVVDHAQRAVYLVQLAEIGIRW
jgi:hypothetical protein